MMLAIHGTEKPRSAFIAGRMTPHFRKNRRERRKRRAFSVLPVPSR